MHTLQRVYSPQLSDLLDTENHNPTRLLNDSNKNEFVDRIKRHFNNYTYQEYVRTESYLYALRKFGISCTQYCSLQSTHKKVNT